MKKLLKTFHKQAPAQRLCSFVEGAEAVLAALPDPAGSGPMKIELDDKPGHTEVWLFFGDWELADGEVRERFYDLTDYETRVRELEAEGLTRSDAQGVADAEILKAERGGK